MRLTIISDDSKVLVNSVGLTVDLTGLPANVHAVQWYSSIGEIEYQYDFVTNTRMPNARFTDLSPYQIFIDRWNAVAALSSVVQISSAIA